MRLTSAYARVQDRALRLRVSNPFRIRHYQCGGPEEVTHGSQITFDVPDNGFSEINMNQTRMHVSSSNHLTVTSRSA